MFSGDYSQEFVIYNETGINISLIVAYHHKFHQQNKKTTVYCLLVCLFSLASITNVMSIFRRQQRFFPLFCWLQRRQTVQTHHASVHQAAKLAAILLRVEGVTAGLAESNDSLTPGLRFTSPAG